jgi:hypothetical protein
LYLAPFAGAAGLMPTDGGGNLITLQSRDGAFSSKLTGRAYAGAGPVSVAFRAPFSDAATRPSLHT